LLNGNSKFYQTDESKVDSLRAMYWQKLCITDTGQEKSLWNNLWVILLEKAITNIKTKTINLIG
jgi:hypothetical protein